MMAHHSVNTLEESEVFIKNVEEPYSENTDSGTSFHERMTNNCSITYKKTFLVVFTICMGILITDYVYFEGNGITHHFTEHFVKTDAPQVVKKTACLCTVEELGGTVGCPITVNTNGRLGNQMGAYATLYGLADSNNMQPYMDEAMQKELSIYFPKLSTPFLRTAIYNKIKWRGIGLHDWMEDSYKNFLCNATKCAGYPNSFTFYHHLRENIRKEFTFSEGILADVKKFLAELTKTKNKGELVFIGIHVRRGDYITLMTDSYNGVLADSSFFDKAMDFYRKRHANIQFIVSSDDLEWCKKNLNFSKGDLVVAWNGDPSTPGKDMALLTGCDHSIYTIGTFGFWSSYLAGGHVVYMSNFTRKNSKFNHVFIPKYQFLPEWTGIPANLSSLGWL